MCAFKKFTFIYALFGLSLALLVPVSSFAYEVSACGGCKSPDADPDAKGFYDQVKGYSNWSGNFYKKYENCKEIHYKKSPNGQENSWIDTSDIHYHVSHGGGRFDSGYNRWLTAIIFEDGNSLVPSEAQNAWGNNDLEWLGFRCCTMLNNASWKYWAKAMNRLHLICGFRTVSCVDDDYGEIWGEEMSKDSSMFPWWRVGIPDTGIIIPVQIPKKTITQAWFSATDKTQPRAIVARVVAETYKCYNDHLHGFGSVCDDPAVDKWKWRWDHISGSPNYLEVDHLEEMYIYEVQPPVVNVEYVEDIGDAFGFTDEAVAELGERYVMSRLEDPNDSNSPAHLLEVYKNSGQYFYYDLGKLWHVDPCEPNEPIYDPCQASSHAYTFLDTHNLLPSAGEICAQAVKLDVVVMEDTEAGGGIGSSFPRHTCAVITRKLRGSPFYTDDVSVAGPGARIKVYIHENGDITGAMGNWREVQQCGSVPVMTKEDTWSLFERHAEKVSIAPVLLEYDMVEADMNSATQAFYEYSGMSAQGKLVPVWIYDANYYNDSNFVATSHIYIPAANSFCPPVAEINSPEDESEYNEANPVIFDGVVDSNLGTPPYTYEWSSNVDGVLSNEPNFVTSSLTVSCTDYGCDCDVLPHRITFTVTDSQGLQSTDVVNVTIQGTCPGCPKCADLNRDGIVDLKDLAIFGASWMAISQHEN